MVSNNLVGKTMPFTTDWEKEEDCACPKCRKHTVSSRKWESSDGAFEDYYFQCECGYNWWVDGIDS